MESFKNKVVKKIRNEDLTDIQKNFFWLVDKIPEIVSNYYYRKKLTYKYDHFEEPFKYTWVDPDSINKFLISNKEESGSDESTLHRTCKKKFEAASHTGCIIDGSWDLNTIPHENDRLYISLNKIFRKNVDWEKTQLGRQYLKTTANYEQAQDNINRKHRLYQSIKNNGYQIEFSPSFINLVLFNPVTVNVGRNGEFIFNNTGHSRLAVSKILDLDEIPVVIVVKHPNQMTD